MKETTKAYLKEYKKSNCKQVCFSLSKKYDADIIEFLDKQESKQGTIKALIRRRIAEEERADKLADIIEGTVTEGGRGR